MPPTRSTRRIILSAVCCALVLAGAGCRDSSEAPGEPTAPATVYRHAMDGAPRSLDPAQASSVYAKMLAVNLFDTLYRYKYLARPYELAPNLAEDMPQVSADGLIYTIRIRPGVRFIDDAAFPEGQGREVRAQDFVYSIKRHFDPSMRAQGAWLWQGRIVGLDDWKASGSDYDAEVPGLRALDDHTIQIQLISPFPQLTHTLAQGFAAIVPREAVERYGPEFAVRPVGSGPYRLTRFDSAGAVLERNPSFRALPFNLEAEGYDPTRQGELGLERLEGAIPPFTDRIEVEFIAEDAARWNAFIAGETDFIKAPVTQFDRILQERDPPQLLPELAARYRLAANLESGFVHTDFNMDDPRIGYHHDADQRARNTALRCAIIKAFDWQRRNEVFYYGIGRVFPGIIPPSAAEFDAAADRQWVTRDLDAARDLLRDAGWHAGNLPVLEYGFPASVTERQMFEQFRSFMGDIGYPAEKIRPLTFATYGDYARAYLNREVMLTTTGWTMDYPDTENTMQLFYGPNASPGSNSANYDDPEFNRLYRAAAVMQPSPMRTALYRNMNRIVLDDCVTISGIARTLILLWDRDLVMLPDRSFVGGFFFRFVGSDRQESAAGAAAER
ncbi:MAG: ABC transporter substrate-binding protein [Xanthomonadales bacterium]